jgi:hypothetical protein
MKDEPGHDRSESSSEKPDEHGHRKADRATRPSAKTLRDRGPEDDHEKDTPLPRISPPAGNVGDLKIGDSYEIVEDEHSPELIRRRPAGHAAASALATMLVMSGAALPANAALPLQIDLSGLAIRGHMDTRPPICKNAQKMVSIIVTGAAGQSFTYAGTRWTLPAGEKRIEIVANPKKKTYEFDGHSYPLTGALDSFGALHIQLPEPTS